MSGADLLWIDCNEPKSAKRYEVAAAARQHVMLNYLAKQQPIYSLKPHGDDRKQLQGSPAEQDDQVDEDKEGPTTARRPQRHSNALKGKGSRVKRSMPLSNQTKIPLASSINPALILAKDKEIYQAAWWHSLNICQTTQRNGWIDVCRSQWGQGFWEFARGDGTLREIFLSYAAAKEASVKSLSDSRAYFIHKGRAMRLVAEDLEREGKDLRLAAVAAICLLAKATFIEEEYEAGEAHVRAIKAVIEERLFELPSFLWLFVIWADLRLTGVTSRSPALPYALHPDFVGVELPVKMEERAKFWASCNMLAMPKPEVLSEDRTTLLFQKLHELTLVYNSPNEVDWPPVWVATYDAAWMLADMRHTVRSLEEAKDEDETPYNPEHIMLLGASIQMWSTVCQFVPQPGFLRYALDYLSKLISHLEPSAISSHWLSCSGTLLSLLWLLSNASAAAVKLCFTGHLSTTSMPHWLWLSLQHVTDLLTLTSASEFEKALRTFPYSDNWNRRMGKLVWLWLKTGFVLPDGIEKRRRKPFFAEFRLTFDVEVDERMGKDERVLAGKAFSMALEGNDRD